MKNNSWSLGSAKRFSKAGSLQPGFDSPNGRAYYRYSRSEGDRRTRSPSFGVGERASPGFYPEDLKARQGKVSPSEYSPVLTISHRASRKTSLFGAVVEPKDDDKPGPGTYTVRDAQGPCHAWDIRLRGGRPHTAVGFLPPPSEGMLVSPGPAARNLRDSDHKRRGVISHTFGGPWMQDPIVLENQRKPGPGTYTLPSNWPPDSMPPKKGLRRPASAPGLSRADATPTPSLDGLSQPASLRR